MVFKSGRFVQLDVLRGLSIIGVILIHIIGGSLNFWSRDSIAWPIFITLDQFFRFSVPLFVFISGLSLYSKYRHNFEFKDFYKKRISRVLPWYLAWSLIIYVYLHSRVPEGFVDYPTWKLILLGKVDYHLYFVSMIFQLYILFPLLLWLFGKLKLYFLFLLFIFTIILYFVFTLDGLKIIELPWRFYEQQQYLFFGTWVFYFVLGFFFADTSLIHTKLDLIKHRMSIIKMSILLFTILSLIYSIYDSLILINFTSDTNVATRTTRIPILLYSCGFIVTTLVYSDLLLKINKFFIKILLYFANISYLVFLIHVLVIRVLSNFILPSSLFNLIIFTILVFGLSIFLAQLSISLAKLISLQKINYIRKFIYKAKP